LGRKIREKSPKSTLSPQRPQATIFEKIDGILEIVEIVAVESPSSTIVEYCTFVLAVELLRPRL